MAFQSALRPKEFIVDDQNYLDLAPPEDPVIDGQRKTRGRVPRDWAKVPYGSMPYAAPFNLPLIPRSEWTDRIEHMEKTRSRLSDISDAHGLKSLDQNGTNYCWANGVVTAMEVLQAKQNEKYVKLSSASVAAPIKNFRNQGGWGSQALEYIVKYGCATAEIWPPNGINRKYWTEEAKADAAKRKITEWWDIKPRSFDQLMTCLLLRIPVPIGLNWWRHEVCAMDPVVISSGKFGARIRNSWGDGYGDHGFAVLTESKATPDDAVAPRVVSAQAA